MKKTDGCMYQVSWDNNDWVQDCEQQMILYPAIESFADWLEVIIQS